MGPECKFDVVALFFFFPLFCFVFLFRGGVAIQTQSSGKLSRYYFELFDTRSSRTILLTMFI